MSYYPAFLDLRGRAVLVVGGGPIAEQKVAQLQQALASVRLVSPDVTTTLRELAERGRIMHEGRSFQADDLDGVWLVVAATDDAEVQRTIARLAEERRIWCNIVDVIPLCSFIAPAVVRRGPVQVAVSTSGTSPALAQRIKHDIGRILGPEHQQLAEILGRWRGYVQRRVPEQNRRAELFQSVLESDALALLRVGRTSQAKSRIKQLLQS